MSNSKGSPFNKTNGRIYPSADPINDLPGYIDNEVEFEGQQISIPNVNKENQLTNDFVTKSVKQQLTKEVNKDQEKKAPARKLKTFEIVLKKYLFQIVLLINLCLLV